MRDLDSFIAAHKASRRKDDWGDEIRSEEGVWCPKCDYFHEATGDFWCDAPPEIARDGEYWNIECESCGLDIEIRTEATFTWIVERPEDEQQETPND